LSDDCFTGTSAPPMHFQISRVAWRVIRAMLIVKREISIGVELWAVFTRVRAASTLAEIAISGLRLPKRP